MSDNLFSQDRALKAALCTLFAGASHLVMYGHIFHAIQPAAPLLLLIDGLLAAALFGLAMWGLSRYEDPFWGDAANFLIGCSTLVMFLVVGTAIAWSAGALWSIGSGQHVAVSGGFWTRAGMSALWVFVAMFVTAFINNIEVDFQPRRCSQGSGGDFKMPFWTWR